MMTLWMRHPVKTRTTIAAARISDVCFISYINKKIVKSCIGDICLLIVDEGFPVADEGFPVADEGFSAPSG